MHKLPHTVCARVSIVFAVNTDQRGSHGGDDSAQQEAPESVPQVNQRRHYQRVDTTSWLLLLVVILGALKDLCYVVHI